MDSKLNAGLVKALREKNAWSQDQLAQAAGLSLRTVQRIEKNGVASMDSRAAIAVVFGMDAENLCQTGVSPIDNGRVRGVAWGFAGLICGLLCAYASITFALIDGNISSGEAGIYYGSIGAFCGAGCAILGVVSEHLKKKGLIRISD